MRDIYPSIQILTGCIASVIVLSIAVSAPLLKASHAGKVYELHIFPRNDAIEHDTSIIHRTSQVIHCLAIVFFVLASIAAASIFATGSALQQKRIATVLAAFTHLGAALHFVALVTLLKLAVDWTHKLERLPVPVPDVDVAFQGAFCADVWGYMITLGTSFIAFVSASRLRRVSYVQL